MLHLVSIVLFAALSLPSSAQTWQKVLTLPTVTAGAACSTTGAIGADTAGSVYSCKSGVWTAIGSGGGASYGWKYPEGTSVQCTTPYGSVAMSRINGGVLQTRAIAANPNLGSSCDSGWKTGISAQCTLNDYFGIVFKANTGFYQIEGSYAAEALGDSPCVVKWP